MRHQRGLSLIELVIFIVVMGIMASGALIAFKNVLLSNNSPGADLQAAQLADARMNILLISRLTNGFPLVSDPCVAGSPAACTALASYATTTGLTVGSSIGAASGGVQTVTITVTGNGQATNVTRFVQ